MIAKSARKLIQNPQVVRRSFSTLNSGTTSATSDEELLMSTELRAKIDPMKGQLQDFLKNVNIFEEQTKDVENPYFMELQRLPGFATA
jgi:uncharacterized protein YnzC (UPF0291/DUF896 family)